MEALTRPLTCMRRGRGKAPPHPPNPLVDYEKVTEVFSGSTWTGWECFSTAEGNNGGSKTWKHVYREGQKGLEAQRYNQTAFMTNFTENMGGTHGILFKEQQNVRELLGMSACKACLYTWILASILSIVPKANQVPNHFKWMEWFIGFIQIQIIYQIRAPYNP